MRRHYLMVFLCTLFASAATAQTVTIGSQSVNAGAILNSATPPFTLIDLSHPATANGTINYVSVGWGGGSCTGGFKVKILRPAATNTLTTFTLAGERGPFTALAGRNRVQLTPPLDVQKGDLIAVTMLQTFATCGSAKSWFNSGSTTMRLNGDVSSGSFNGFYFRDQALGARGSDTAEVLEGVIAAAGSVQGANGSFFRTSLQIACPYGGQCTGTIAFHPAGTPFSPADQIIPYTVTGQNGTAYTDVVEHMGKSGLGTLDVISNDGFPPLVIARVYNDSGANGTSGFTEEMIRPADFLRAGDVAILVTPLDTGAFRMNIGVRTLSNAANITIQYADGTVLTKDFPANTFNQLTLAQFGDPAPVPSQQIAIIVNSGELALYASTTDNKTNDSSARFAKRE
ncbi:MAG TPA: hypothetical protein VII75_13725 [Thermoanaerobaculia bacterium]|nr:hypothetical protein [Thermoanaerobaculia bacterium]